MNDATEVIAQDAIGGLKAQQVIDGMRAEQLTSVHAWLAFIELASSTGWKSAACRSFVAELSKRAAAA